MRTMELGKSGLTVPVIAAGCWRMNKLSVGQAETWIAAALNAGVNFFDHADVYGGGECEAIFGQALSNLGVARDRVIIQSKCGIRKGMYDFSKEHILEAVEGSLKRLHIDHLDVLLLHRPDALCEPEEVAEAFDSLCAAGKVRNFGVSNHNPGQMRLLQKFLRMPLVANQMQLSAAHTPLIDAGVNVNTFDDRGVDRDGGVLDFCRLNDITIQPWSPFQYGFMRGVFVDNPDFSELNRALAEVGEAHGVTKTSIALAWLLRHPAKMQPIVGTMKPERLSECATAADVQLTRREWYDIYLAAGNKLP